MSIKALFIANAVMILFVGLVIVQSLGGMNSDGLISKMHEHGFVKDAASAS